MLLIMCGVMVCSPEIEEGVQKVNSSFLQHTVRCNAGSEARKRIIDQRRGQKISDPMLQKLADFLQFNLKYRQIRAWIIRNGYDKVVGTSAE